MLARLRCWLSGGHQWILRLSARAIFLECLRCGRETPGWRMER